MNWHQSMEHKGPVLRPRCIGTERAQTQLLLYSTLMQMQQSYCGRRPCVTERPRGQEMSTFHVALENRTTGLCDVEGGRRVVRGRKLITGISNTRRRMSLNSWSIVMWSLPCLSYVHVGIARAAGCVVLGLL
jgi:hypothetical protein